MSFSVANIEFVLLVAFQISHIIFILNILHLWHIYKFPEHIYTQHHVAHIHSHCHIACVQSYHHLFTQLHMSSTLVHQTSHSYTFSGLNVPFYTAQCLSQYISVYLYIMYSIVYQTIQFNIVGDISP